MAIEPEHLRIRDLIGNLKISQIFGVLSAAFVVIAASASVGYYLRGLEEREKLDRQQVATVIAEAFSSIRNEHIPWDDSDRIMFVENAPKKTTVFVQLAEVPIRESVRLQFGGFTAPAGAFEQLHNILLVAAGDTESTVRSSYHGGISISYVPDPAESEELYELGRRHSKIFASGTLLFDGERTLWPSGGTGPFDEY